MAEAGFLDRKPIRPGAAAAVILLHGAAVGALLLIKNPEVARTIFEPTVVFDVPREPPPPPPPQPPQPDRPLVQETYVTTPPIPSPLPSPFAVPPSPPVPPPDTGALSGTRSEGTPYVPPVVEDRPPTPPAPPREIVRTEARIASGSELQPPYPPSEQRLEREGRVVIRVTIGADGRVKAAQKVSATSDAFYTATERHARARWRFRPATVDGQAVETTKTMTVVFQLDA